MKRDMGSSDRLIRIGIVAPVLIVLSVAVFGVGSVLGIVALARDGGRGVLPRLRAVRHLHSARCPSGRPDSGRAASTKEHWRGCAAP